MGLIFLRHAYSRFLKVKSEIESSLPKRGGKPRALTKADFAKKSAIYLRKEAQFEYLVSLPSEKDRAKAIIDAMDSIEGDYEELKGILPKQEYRELDNDVLGSLLRTFNDPALKKASGDIFGRIYEYFLTGFADQKAHDSGEFFTPVSIVQTIVNVIEPGQGKILDPACGSGGMFVQSAHFIENMHNNPSEKVIFYGMEKNPTTIRLAKMNLAVHGLEGNIQKAITYYEDPHGFQGKADFVMANPPFNVDEVDAEKVKPDPRLPFGLPGVNKKEKVSNGNYLWISYFYSYLNDKGRSGFVMSAQASSAGNKEAKVRQKIIETGHVDVMISIRGGFFYTRTVPCELWFFDRNKPEKMKNKVLMIDARNIHRKVTRTIYDFSPEQMKNISSVIWLYRGQTKRSLNLAKDYLTETQNRARLTIELLKNYTERIKKLSSYFSLNKDIKSHIENLEKAQQNYAESIQKACKKQIKPELSDMKQQEKSLSPVSEQSRDLIMVIEVTHKKINEAKNVEKKHPDIKEINKKHKELEDMKNGLIEELKLVRYYFRQYRWLMERFPEAKLKDIEGLCKLVDISEIKSNDWSLAPGRYVGVAPEEEDENFDFKETMRDIHNELQKLNKESIKLAAKIQNNFKELGI